MTAFRRISSRREGKLTLAFVDAAFVYYVKGVLRLLAESMQATPYNAKLELQVREVLRDEPDPVREPGAHIASGIQYVIPQRGAEFERAERMIAELRL